jgi:ketosteroid isomerase-like protein
MPLAAQTASHVRAPVIARALLLAACAGGCGTDAGESVARSTDLEAARSLIAAERAFAAAAQTGTVQDAFLASLADDGILFRPAATNGHEWLLANPMPADLMLDWRPAFADVSAAGDLGYTTGAWDSGRRGAVPGAHGNFVSVWKRTEGGPWKVALDVGISHGEPGARDTTVAIAAFPPDTVERDVEDSRDRLLNTDLEFDAAATNDPIAAFEAYAAPSIRVYRNGHLPAVGSAAAKALLAKTPLPTTWQPAYVGMAASADLGYTYGTYQATVDGGEPEAGNYLRIWRRQPDGRWMVVADLTDPIPPDPEPQPIVQDTVPQEDG